MDVQDSGDDSVEHDSCSSVDSVVSFKSFFPSILQCGFLRDDLDCLSTVTLPPRPTVAQSSKTPPCYTSDSQFRNTIVAVTNKFRCEHNATALKWNRTLEVSSQNWARKCRWEHSTSGENLAMGYANVTATVQAWGDERRTFNFNKPRFTHETGHFSQLVWKGTKTMGCARFDCGKANPRDRDDDAAHGWYVVCQYFPPGNVVGVRSFEENVQPRVSGGVPRLKSGVFEWWALAIVLAGVLVGIEGVCYG
ncbi:hypothetical protein GX48_05578 [Paracoccidioides brasiliensis]|nr:hypothetical protein GX48_05578 [Paracoccidioides brasiliensis]